MKQLTTNSNKTAFLVLLSLIGITLASSILFSKNSIITCILVYLLFFGIASFVFYKISKNNKVFKWTIAIFITLVSLEVGLRLTTNSYYTYTERNGTSYISPYQNVSHQGWVYAYVPGSKVNLNRTEFNFSFTNNEFGISDQSFQASDKDKYKILALGDSFTEGVGAEVEDSWPRNLSAKFDSAYSDSIEVINGGIGGSDLFYAWKLYEERLFQYEPDEIIFFLGVSDLEDILIRGGDSRFKSDGTVQYKSAPKTEWIFKYSFIFRFILMEFFGYNFQLLNNTEYHEGIQKSCVLMYDKLQEISQKLQSSNIKMKVIIHPVSYEVKVQEYSFPCFKQLVQSDNYQGIDLLNTINTTYQFDMNNFEDYYWPIDNHFTAKGYELVANEIFLLYQ